MKRREREGKKKKKKKSCRRFPPSHEVSTFRHISSGIFIVSFWETFCVLARLPSFANETIGIPIKEVIFIGYLSFCRLSFLSFLSTICFNVVNNFLMRIFN